MAETSFRTQIRLRAAAHRRRITFPESTDVRTLEAVAQLHEEQLCIPVLVGDTDQIRSALTGYTKHADRIEIFDPDNDERVERLAIDLAERRQHRGWTVDEARARLDNHLVLAGMLVRNGIADGLVAGAVATTADVIRAAIWTVGTAANVKAISSSFYLSVQSFRGVADEVLTFTDAGVIADPTAAELVDIATAAVAARRTIVGDEPVVAFLSFSTKGSANSPSVAKVREAAAAFAAAHPTIASDGELQADAALVEGIALRKAPGSRAAGRANILVFPNLDAGNIGYKLVQRLTGADAVGPILQGLDRPCSDLSRGALTADIVDAACITALQAADVFMTRQSEAQIGH